MTRSDGNSTTQSDPVVWVLGRRHTHADKSIMWHEKLPNLSDPDVLVVDMTALDRATLARLDKRKLDVVHVAIRDRLLRHGTAVVITSRHFSIEVGAGNGMPGGLIRSTSHSTTSRRTYSNYDILPVNLQTKSVEDGHVVNADADHDFMQYIDTIQRFSFYFEAELSPVINTPEMERFYKQFYRRYTLAKVVGQSITDNAGHYLGFTLVKRLRALTAPGPDDDEGGWLVLLPPTEPAEMAIEKILEAYKKFGDGDMPPEWALRLDIGPARKLEKQIAVLEKRKNGIDEEIDALTSQKSKVLSHGRLLYSSGPALETAVVNAFKAIGFDDIRRIGGADKEDAAFGMGEDTGYSHGVIEVKGVDKRIQIQHILQCNRWTDRRAADGKKPSKGIFVANQHRLQPYPKSMETRIHIEPNQLDQAKLKDVCIIPSCALFEAVRQVFDGRTPDRATIAAKIAASKGVLTDVL